MERFIKHFRKQADGRWICFEQATLETPAGRIQVTAGTVLTRGAKFMNFDIAAALDEQHERFERLACGLSPGGPEEGVEGRGTGR